MIVADRLETWLSVVFVLGFLATIIVTLLIQVGPLLLVALMWPALAAVVWASRRR